MTKNNTSTTEEILKRFDKKFVRIKKIESQNASYPVWNSHTIHNPKRVREFISTELSRAREELIEEIWKKIPHGGTHKMYKWYEDQVKMALEKRK